LVCKTFHSSI